MRLSSQLLLTFLLNACWQVALIAGMASLGSWLLRNSVARYRHWVWAAALCLAFSIPSFTASRTLFNKPAQTITPITLNTESRLPFASEAVPTLTEFEALAPSSTWKLNQTLGGAR